MNYDGPSFYRKKESGKQKEQNQKLETPLDHLRKEKELRNRLSEENLSTQKRNAPSTGNYYFRSKHIPKSLQKRVDWKRDSWNREWVSELEKRLKKDSVDYLLFADHLNEEIIEEVVDRKGKRKEDTRAETMRIKKMVDEIESTLDTAALVQHEMKPDLTKPNTGLHRTLSNIVVEDKERIKNKK